MSAKDNITYIKYTPINKISSSVNSFESRLNSILPIPEENHSVETPVVPEIEELYELSTPIWGDFHTSTTSTGVTTPVPTNLNLNNWDLSKTLSHLRSHAHDKSTHWCAKYVREALEAGGLKGFRVPNAKDEVYMKTLESIGFKRVAEATDNKVSGNYTPLAGDIAISYENGNHASMYDGSRWISDFRLNGLDVYQKRNTKSIIYRRIAEPDTLLASKKLGGIFSKSRELAIKHLNK